MPRKLPLLVCLWLVGCSAPEAPGPAAPPLPVPDPAVWRLDGLEAIGGLVPEVLGQPVAIETPHGTALEFDGQDDGLILGVHPLAGATEFTIEVILRPDAGGAAEQRFLHLQQQGSDDRVMIETRLTGDGRWFLDTHVESRDEGYTLYADRYKHRLGPWYHVALVVGAGEMTQYVDGVREISRPIDYSPQRNGTSSLGVRLNRVYWFKGAILEVRFTPRALSPDAFRTLEGR